MESDIGISPLSREGEVYVISRIQGDSLTGDGILEGDNLIIRTTSDESDLTPARPVSVETPDGLLAKHYYRCPDGMIVLRSSNPAYSDKILAPGQCHVRGVVEYAIRYFKKGRFLGPPLYFL